MQIQTNIALQSYHTFATKAYAQYWAVVQNLAELQELVSSRQQYYSLPILVLGGGSNVLFTQNYTGLVLLNQLKGIEVVQENEEWVWLRVMGGEIWDDLVHYCVTKNWGGLENLSLIPGTVGAAPIQNIGAYGAELADVFHSAEVLCLSNNECMVFSKSDCVFGYRDSFFKRQKRGEYFIYALTICLSKKPYLRLGYGDIGKVLAEQGIENPTLQTVRDVVCTIRQRKLPDPKQIGNAGSFFKNPEICSEKYKNLKKKYENMPAYNASNGTYKIPAAWLIEQCQWKGKRIGDVGTYPNHALVLVNYGQATGQQIYAFAQAIMASVKTTFAIDIVPEVNIL